MILINESEKRAFVRAIDSLSLQVFNAENAMNAMRLELADLKKRVEKIP